MNERGPQLGNYSLQNMSERKTKDMHEAGRVKERGKGNINDVNVQ